MDLADAGTARTVEVRAATNADLGDTARLHAQLLPMGLFPQLGVRFLRRWQSSFLLERRGIALVGVEQDGTVAAFLLGSADQNGQLRALVADRRQVAALVVTGVLGLLRQPPLAVWFVRTRAWRYARRLLSLGRAAAPALASPAVAPQLSERRVAVLTAVAVEPRLRGQHVGAELVRQFLQQAVARGATVAELVVDTGPDGAVAFYERLGWTAGGEHINRDGDHVRIYHHSLNTR